MNKFDQQKTDIEDMYLDGMSAKTIALALEVSIETVLSVLESMSIEDVEYAGH